MLYPIYLLIMSEKRYDEEIKKKIYTYYNTLHRLLLNMRLPIFVIITFIIHNNFIKV